MSNVLKSLSITLILLGFLGLAAYGQKIDQDKVIIDPEPLLEKKQNLIQLEGDWSVRLGEKMVGYLSIKENQYKFTQTITEVPEVIKSRLPFINKPEGAVNCQKSDVTVVARCRFADDGENFEIRVSEVNRSLFFHGESDELQVWTVEKFLEGVDMKTQDYESKLNQKIIIQGIAQNSTSGKVIETSDGTLFYLDDDADWAINAHNKLVTVTGVLRKKLLAPIATTDEEGNVSHGIDGESYVLENAEYTVNK